jgi:hypothetical protein
MPTFTAEASLYSSSEQYAAMGTTGALAGGANLVPQQVSALFCIGGFNRTFSVGPLSVTLSGCAIPPRACVRACAFGLCRSFCLP